MLLVIKLLRARPVLWFALLSGFCVTLPAQALTNEEIEQRLLQMEKENAELRQQLNQVEGILKSQGIDPASPLIERRVTSNEQHNIAASRRMDRFEQAVDKDLSRIKIDGFLSAGFSTHDEPSSLKQNPYQFSSGADFESDSVLGMQMTVKINDDAKVVTQLVANGWDGWKANIGWAYLAYDLTEHLEVRAGRMRLPFYYYSESLDVGYSYPWVRPPLTLYTSEISNYDGFDATYTYRWGEVNHRLSAYYGGYSFDENERDKDVLVEGDDVLGVNWTMYWDAWTFRLAYSHLRTQANFEVENFIVFPATPDFVGSLPPEVLGSIPPQAVIGGVSREPISSTVSEIINYYSYSVAYDDGNWLAIMEAAVQDVGDANVIGDAVQGVFTLGYHWGKWMPYGGYGREYYKDALAPDKILARAMDRDYKLGFLGVRYDITPGVAAKLEWNHFYDFKGTVGPFENAAAPNAGNSFDEVNVFTFLIDAVF